MRVALHLEGCRECAARLRAAGESYAKVSNLPPAPVPEPLRTQLQVLASRERARWNSNKTVSLAMQAGGVNIKLAMDNLMCPLAVPLAGGLASSPLFGCAGAHAWIPAQRDERCSTGLYTAATLVEVAPVGINNDEAVVELYVDAKGQATDYSVQQGSVTPRCRRT